MLKFFVYACAIITVLLSLFLILYILVLGLPNLNLDLFALTYNTKNASLLPSLINTLTITFWSLLITTPIGIFSAIFLTQYSKPTSKFSKIIELAAQTLTGIPSIVYGLFGSLLFVSFLGWGYSLIAGVGTLSIMILPLILRTSQEALLAVDPAFKEASFGLGAGKLRTIFRVVLPPALPGILSGIILATGRIVGETAALIFTAGTVAQIASNAFQSSRTLAVHMYELSSEGLFLKQSYATAVVLLVFVLFLNFLSNFLVNKFDINSKKKEK